MWSKKIVMAAVLLCIAGGISAQNYNPSRRNKSKSASTVSVSRNNTEAAIPAGQRTTSARGDKYDPKKPTLNMTQVKKVMEVEIQKNLLERKIQEKFYGGGEGFKRFTQEECYWVLNSYKMLIENFELPEVTRVPLSWYKQYQQLLAQFMPIAQNMYLASRRVSAADYEAEAVKFKALQRECQEFLKQRQPKLTSEQWSALRKKNTKIRIEKYNRQILEARAVRNKARLEAARKKAAGKK